ncbi:glucose-6-phosphate dehydrogenase assembly protein OpcA [Corynebacterium sp. ES2794-CONJ1]|uniref:glucose-6-phosphate dehydrogenase assembly protein OpcA n=1 Tax=unclassified Corynebacterium TaxID=2624378 RepID=UPI00216720F2|nr:MULTISPECIES: glucose-6-phosphate dehydrogenase assembly protein OpcA [unclassified Corynebacterium]MCS4489290.1 glucose-6-phosphate dehydrogenase assembly protein OpcA [Corynebacterium sp. ES2775-CONJ]MCS4491103.1 glucose-6-phosphate dehydrogenase assembly protein OpcA [Corynebacterium sp. ES2715-CONJ3]MCS4531016.1 glucose-6-phosphate dehydrogenase assembly protein OpcA [Corynebacterium sp. ES2730-CONJ]MCU9518383.1 glucose-6-phosphate dehydrogenase assembly protein OpcA [Corynebacterium sp.
MIFCLDNSSTSEIANTLVKMRDNGMQGTTSRVLTLLVVVAATDPLESIIEATKMASREHPSRVIVLVKGDTDADHHLDAEVRIGGDAGASELIIMKLHGEVNDHLVHVVTPLLLPDTPIVVWWPFSSPAFPSEDPLGKIAQRRITDARFDKLVDALYHRRNSYAPGDTDIAWARLTPWRGVLASALDQPPHEDIRSITVFGPANSPSVDLAAGWLVDRLRVPTTRKILEVDSDDEIPVALVEIERESEILVLRSDPQNQTICVESGDMKAKVAVNVRSTADCLAEELRHLDPDAAYHKALRGLTAVHYPSV